MDGSDQKVALAGMSIAVGNGRYQTGSFGEYNFGNQMLVCPASVPLLSIRTGPSNSAGPVTADPTFRDVQVECSARPHTSTSDQVSTALAKPMRERLTPGQTAYSMSG